jgi:[protein-PII] uridylyltransferase
MNTLPTSIEDLINSDLIFTQISTSDNPAPICKQAVADLTEQMNQQFKAGRPVAELVHARADFIDGLLCAAWQSLNLDTATELSLVAVGGYGRGELHPFSDIDLMILLSNEDISNVQDSLEKFLTMLWDVGLDIGHSVRTVEDCVNQAKEDISITTNLMEARLLHGNQFVFDEMIDATSPEHIWPSNDFYRAKWEEQISRHHRFANTEYNLEPNVKNGPGGLRDIQMIDWIVQRHFNTKNERALFEQGLLTEKEQELLRNGEEYLWGIRWALHIVAGRAEDRLLFDHQRNIAALFGFSDNDESLAVEQLMQTYYRWVQAIADVNDLLVQLFDENLLRACEPEQILEINIRFRNNNGYLEAANNKVFTQTPFAILEAFVIMAQDEQIIGPKASTVRLIREASYLINDDFRADPRNRQLFMDVFRSRNKVATQLRRMNRYGILGKYLPAFGKLVGKMQHDLFHIYTVDAHIIEVIKNMRLFSYDNYSEKFPVASSIVTRLPNIEVLYIAGLMHDIAKGRGGDHSEKGMEDARVFCQDHGFSDRDTNMVVWLVQNHLIMSSTSQRKDISDPEEILAFAKLVGDKVHLDYLYTLTVADINGTNPKLWNSWRASLMRQLYLETKRALRIGLGVDIDKEEWVQEAKESSIRILEEKGLDADEVIELWDNPRGDYFLRETAADVAWQTLAISKHGDSLEPLILIKDTSEREHEGATQVFIYAPVRADLFALVSSTFEQLNLSIQDARMYENSKQYCLDTYIVLEADDTPIGKAPTRLAEIKNTLFDALENPQEYTGNEYQHIPRTLKHFSYPTTVSFTTDEGKQQTIIEVVSPDRPGLLAAVARIFIRHGATLQNAKISTLGERVEDVFFVTDKNGGLIKEQARLDSIGSDISKTLDSHDEKS